LARSSSDEAEDARTKGDYLRLFDAARRGLDESPGDARLRYLQVLALARLGDTRSAVALYDRNAIATLDTEDALALKARLSKDLALASQGPDRVGLLRAAGDDYRRIYDRTGGYYPLINAASLLFAAGERNAAHAIARNILARADVANPSDYYAAATAAEAHLVLGEVDRATAALATAAALAGTRSGEFPSTIRQFRWLATAQGIPAEVIAAMLAPIAMATVINFCGHLFAQGDPGEPALKEAVKREIAPLGACVAFGALACGADIVIAEAVLAQGGELNIVLPFSENDFVARSVIVGGEQWVTRYDACRAAATSVTLATRAQCIGDDGQFAYGSAMAMGMTRLRAQSSEAQCLQIAVVRRSDGGAGTLSAADIDIWRASGGVTHIIESDAASRPSGSAGCAIPSRPAAREFRAILFADFAGYSRLTEADLAVFVADAFGALAPVFARFADAVECRNTWGDAIHAIVTTVDAAIALALAIHETLTPARLTAIGLPASGGMRISLHYGPVYVGTDAITGQPIGFGTEVTLAARIEPKVPIGAIYVTQQFAAVAAITPCPSGSFGYVGTIELPKGYGNATIYRVVQD